MPRRKFTFEVTRVDTSVRDFTVVAEDEKEAERMAYEAAANHVWNRGEAEYVLSLVGESALGEK